MAYITPASLSTRQCFQHHYSLPYFQREYKWENSHFLEMLNDIQQAFLSSYEPTHGRRDVSGYPPYFLGSIITAGEVSGKKPLIDGQQRLTSLFLLIAFLGRYAKDGDVKDPPDLKGLLGRVNYGELDYSIEFTAARKAIFDNYIDEDKNYDEAVAAAEDVAGIDDGDKKILEALRSVGDALDSTVKENITFFMDYLVEKVQLIEISVETETEAHRVFVTMNDRGLRLGPIDLLKGKILSQINDATDSRASHAVWIETMYQLRKHGSEEDSLFFRSLLRARWAESMRGKKKDDAPGDFDMIGDAYHRWFEENSQKLKIRTSDDYLKFAKDQLPKYAEIYLKIKEAEENMIPGLESIYYNAARKFSFQSQVLLACIDLADTTEAWKKKINLTARLIDLILTSRAIEGKENNYDNLKSLSFDLTRNLRNKDYDALLAYIQHTWDEYFTGIQAVPSMKYAYADRSDLLYVLARIASHLEIELLLTNKVGFIGYWQRDKGAKTFDIEHLLLAKFDTAKLPNNHGFADSKQYEESRDSIGALVLLSRSRNRSLKDSSYKDKLAAYATENILSQTLASEFYKNNPNVTRYFSENPDISFEPYPEFGNDQITFRAKAYKSLAEKIWSKPA
ncbi:DUF262 domain-containing protein [Lysobacter enzymogenes]|uniref:DUF262 domain-containing protein n=1 Tax=Lysobacter enzymogenes TaxID=69 RepID=UPI001AF90F51|nr:DUF262 domain-containing protein [Lysobacter enzymogenes]QQQ02210.1 DUF262 domain-containing protein [Lysobacter enzymogenes]